MQNIQMNEAATSSVKPAAVVDAVCEAMRRNLHASAGRGAGELAEAAAALESRAALAGLFGCDDPRRVIFTSGATEALNLAIWGLARPGCHVLSTGVEHNAVARPLQLLQQRGLIELDFLPCAPDGTLDPAAIGKAVRPNTRLLVMSQASNVLGTIQPAAECLAAAKAHGLLTILDSAQSAGHIPVAMDEHTDLLVFAGHKGLRALAGSGGMVLGKGAAAELRVWKAGGTGSHSQSLEMPPHLPDRFEPGTQNTLGVLALGAAARLLAGSGLAAIQERERALTARLLDGLRTLPLTVHGPGDAARCVPVVSVSSAAMDAGLLARRLAEEHGVFTRSGLHCAPLAHRTAGTFPAGTLRLSFAAHTPQAHIDATLLALEKVLAAGG